MKYIILLIILSFFSLQDLKRKAIYGNHLMIATVISVFVWFVFPSLTIFNTIAGISIGIGIFLLSLVTKEKIGVGDGLILMISGIFLGGRENFTLLFLGLCYAAVYSLVKIFQRKIDKKQELSFIPFLTASYITLLWMLHR